PDPSAIVLMIDRSRDMFTSSPGAQKSPIEQARDVAEKLVGGGLEGKNEMAVDIFDTDTFDKIQDYTSNQMEILSKLNTIKDAPANEGTCLYDAIYRALEDVNTSPHPAKAIVVITNNR